MKLFVVGIAAVMLTGCGNQPTVGNLTGLGPSTAALDDQTLALSCADLSTRNSNIHARVKELEAEQKAEARTNAVTDAVVGAGLTAIMGAGMQGGLSGIRTASTAVQGIETVRNAERGLGSMASVSDSVALVQRSSQLQRAMIEKGC